MLCCWEQRWWVGLGFMGKRLGWSGLWIKAGFDSLTLEQPYFSSSPVTPRCSCWHVQLWLSKFKLQDFEDRTSRFQKYWACFYCAMESVKIKTHSDFPKLCFSGTSFQNFLQRKTGFSTKILVPPPPPPVCSKVPWCCVASEILPVHVLCCLC